MFDLSQTPIPQNHPKFGLHSKRWFYCECVTLNPLNYAKSQVLAVWISPVNQNYRGPSTAYGDPYHGYWISDVSQLNERFGTSDDLKALSAELHKRKMYILSQL